MKKILCCCLFALVSSILLQGQTNPGSSKKDAGKEISAQEMQQVKTEIINLLRKNYVFEDRVEALITDFSAWFDSKEWPKPVGTSDFLNEIHDWLVNRTADKHFYLKEVGPTASKAGAMTNVSWFFDKYNYGLAKVEWIPQGIGYIDYRAFNFTQVSESRKVLQLAFELLGKADTIILDLRNNTGGDGSMSEYLYSYFIPEDSIPLITYTDRRDGKTTVTTDYSYKSMPLPRCASKKLYILTSKKTASAAELFTFLCKVNNRATIIGEKTIGAGHNMGTFPLGTRFTFGLPTGRFYDPKTGLGWQETGGVSPDFEVDADKALEQALTLIKKRQLP